MSATSVDLDMVRLEIIAMIQKHDEDKLRAEGINPMGVDLFADDAPPRDQLPPEDGNLSRKEQAEADHACLRKMLDNEEYGRIAVELAIYGLSKKRSWALAKYHG